MRSRSTVVIAGLLIGAICLVLAGRSVDFGTIAGELLQAHRGLLSGALAAALAFTLLKAARWHYLVRPLAAVPMRALVGPVFASSAANALIPHSGEFLRAAMVGHRCNVPASALLGSIVIERLFDFLAVLSLGALAFVFADIASEQLVAASYVLAAISLVLVAGAGALVFWTAGCIRIAEWLLSPLPARWRDVLLGHLHHVAAGLGSLRRPELLLPVLVFSALQWSSLVVCILLSMAAVGQPITTPLAVSILVLCTAGLTLPAAPGYVGTTQLAFTITLGAAGISDEKAFAGSILYNVAVVLPVLIVGLSSLRSLVSRPSSTAHGDST